MKHQKQTLRAVCSFFSLLLLTALTLIFSSCHESRSPEETVTVLETRPPISNPVTEETDLPTANLPDAPQILYLENWVLYWKPVENATQYTVELEGKSYTTSQCYYDLSLDLTETGKAYNIRLRATGEETKDGQRASNWTTYTYTVPAITPGLAYTLTEDGTGYIISGVEDTRIFVNEFYENHALVLPSYHNGKPVIAVEQFFIFSPNTGGCPKSLVLPSKVRELRDGAFQNLKVSRLVLPPELKVIDGAFLASSVRDVILPDSLEVLNGGFMWCTQLRSITLPEGLRELDSYSFDKCTSLREIYLPDSLTELSSGTFSECSSLTKVRLPAGITAIPNACFEGCNVLDQVEIPAGVTSIGQSAFKDCFLLNTISFPEGITYVGLNAFENTMLINVSAVLDKENLYAGKVLLKYNQLTADGVADQFAADTVMIASTAFSGNPNVRKVILPEDIDCLYNSSFKNCTGLREVILPNGLKTIENMAFMGCSALESIVIPAGVSSFGSRIFEGCTSLVSVELPASMTTLTPNFFEGCTSLVTVKLPASLTTLGSGCFSHCTSLASIELPASLTTMYRSCFAGCTSLSSIVLPDSILFDSYSSGGNNTLGIFENCTSLKEITLPVGITSLPGYIFKGCTALQHVTLPEGLTDLGTHSFENCTSLREVDLPDTIVSINASAFAGCTALETIRLPESVTALYGGCFQNSGISEITLPKGLTKILKDAFAGCTKLQYIVIPADVEIIKLQAVAFDAALTSVLWLGDLSSADSANVKKMFAAGTTVYVTVAPPENASFVGGDASGCTILYGCTVSEDGGYVTALTVTGSAAPAAVAALHPPARKGYTFAGWATTADGAPVYQMSDLADVVSDTVLYAVWVAEA